MKNNLVKQGCLDEEESFTDVYAVQGNYVIDLNSFSSILQEVAIC